MFSNGSSSSISLLTVPAGRAHRHGHRVGQLVHAGQHLGPRGVVE
jgi:hypothetical protein